ncbi:hypothetical protein EDD17DRAFT_1596037 [Pisolithus thermaeus]|nr:hypothetical protein EDD17DRAFT_1596037 [Pisolithus thermaeus]
MTAPCYLHGAGKSSVCDATALTVAWRAHRRDFVPQYFDETTMLAKVRDSISNDFGHTSHAETTGDAEQVCSICRDHTLHPMQLGCGHTYCSACLRHFIVSVVTHLSPSQPSSNSSHQELSIGCSEQHSHSTYPDV